MQRLHRARIVFPLLLLLSAVPLVAQDAKPVFYSASGYVSALGKWKLVSGKPGDELPFKHAVQIQCRLDIRECYEATAQIVGNEPQILVQNYVVVEWDKNGIVAVDSSPICVTNRLLINLQEQSVMAVDQPKNGAKGMPLGGGRDACQAVSLTRSFKFVGP